MNDPIITLRAMFDSGFEFTIQSKVGRRFSGFSWRITINSTLYESSEARPLSPESAIEDLAAVICSKHPDSDFARFHRGEINYFRCGICGQPCFGVQPVPDAESGECCPECFAAACRDEKVWSSECPGIPGWYWFKRDDGRGMVIIRLVEGLDGMGAWSATIPGVLDPDTMRGQWWGPIPAPEE